MALEGTARATVRVMFIQSKIPLRKRGAYFRSPIVAMLVVPAFLAACTAKGRCGLSGVQAEVSGNHGHMVTIPGEAVDRGIGGTYAVRGGDHEHAVTFRDSDFKKLANGERVEVLTTSVQGHTHSVMAQCNSR
jgi:hypothetical protein